MDINNKIEYWYPNIIGKPYKILKIYSIEEDKFNCVSYSLDIYDDWIWTNEKSWPNDISGLEEDLIDSVEYEWTCIVPIEPSRIVDVIEFNE